MKQTCTRWLPLAAGLLLHVPTAQAQDSYNSPADQVQQFFSQLPQPGLLAGAPALRHALPTDHRVARALPLEPTRPAVPQSNQPAGARSVANGPVSEQWVARFDNSNGNGYDGATDVVADVAGNVYVTGYSFSTAGGYDYATVKYDPNGRQVWQVRYNAPGSGDDVAVGLTVDQAGNVYVTGYSYGTNSLYDYATVKYNGSTGQELWVSRYTSEAGGLTPSSHELAASLAVDAAGNVVVTGTAYVDQGSGYHYATIKYSTNGQLLWVNRSSGLSTTAVASGLALDATGNIYVTGTSYLTTGSDYATLKFSPSGQQLWVARYAGPTGGYNLVRDLAVDAAGNVVVTGTSAGGNSYDYATVKYSASGQQQWAMRYNGGGNGYDEATGVAVDATGNIAVTGYADTGNSNWNYVTIKYAATTGQQAWLRTYDGPASSYDEAQDIVVDAAGNVAVTGRSYNAQGTSEYATVKYAGSSGQPLWQARVAETATRDAAATSLAADGAGNVAVTGYSVTVGSSTDYATLKYTAATGQSLWQARYMGPVNEDRVSDLAVDGAGNVYVTGNRTVKYAADGRLLWTAPGGSHVVVSPSGDLYVTGGAITRKYSASGQQLWETRVTAEGGYQAAGIGLDAAGNVYISGTLDVTGSRNQYITLKYDAATGQQLWEARYMGTGVNRGNAVVDMAVDAAGNVYVIGISNSAQNYWNYATIKYSPQGQQMWLNIYTGYYGYRDSQPSGIALDASGNVYVTGSGMVSAFPLDIDYNTVKYSPTGQMLWARNYDGGRGSYDLATDIAVDASGNVCVTGQPVTISYTTTGGDRWMARHNETSVAQGSRLAVDGQGNAYVMGTTGTDYATVKYAAATGQALWATRYNGPGNGYDQVVDIAVTTTGDVYVTGNSLGLGTGSDYATIKYVQPVVAATQASSSKEGSSSQELAVYPNPVLTQATVRFRPHVDGEGHVRVYNQLGQEVALLYAGAVRKGQEYVLPLASHTLAPGIYQCRLTINGQHEVVRLLVAR